MANNTIKRVWNANKLVSIEDLSGMTFQGENGGHTFEVSGVDDSGSAVSISGTVTAVFLRADNAAISISGSISSGKAVATLTSDCYTVPGRFMFTIFVTANSQKTAIYSATGNVARTEGTATGSVPPLVTDSIQTGSITASGDVTVGGVLDVTNRRCYATLSSAGWYRVFNVTGGLGRGGSSFSVTLNIGRSYVNENNELHTITLLANYYSYEFVGEVSKSNVRGISAVRYTADSSNHGHIDVYYDLNAENVVYIDFDVHCRPENAYLIRYNAVTPTGVDPSPSGETVLTEYTFTWNVGSLKSYVDASAENYTIGSDGYVMVNYPTGLTGNNVVSIGIESWTSHSGPFLICPYGSTNTYWFIIGASGTTISGVKFRYWYI